MYERTFDNESQTFQLAISQARLPAAVRERSQRSSPELTAGLVDLALLIRDRLEKAAEIEPSWEEAIARIQILYMSRH